MIRLSGRDTSVCPSVFLLCLCPELLVAAVFGSNPADLNFGRRVSFDWQLILPFSADTSSVPTMRDDVLDCAAASGGGGSCLPLVSRWTGSAAPECLEKEPFSFFFVLGKKTVSVISRRCFPASVLLLSKLCALETVRSPSGFLTDEKMRLPCQHQRKSQHEKSNMSQRGLVSFSGDSPE